MLNLNLNLQNVVVDLDGTLANHNHRKHHIPNWEDYHAGILFDEPYENIVRILNVFSYTGHKTIAITGRPEKYRPETVCWLRGIGLVITPDLLMRPNDDFREDSIVKIELAKSNGISPSNTLFVLDDRDRVVKAWREAGFTCLQVQEGNY